MHKLDKKLTVVIPTYNEADNVQPMTEALFDLGLPNLDILIVDDESSDGTGQIADGLAAQYPERVHVLHRTGLRGLGRAYVDGFRRALQHGADYVVQMDCDFSHSPAYVPQFLEHIEGYDVVVGSRYVEGGQTDERWGWGRWFLSWWADSIYTRVILGCSTKDATTGFKCWRRETLQGIDLSRINSQGYVFQMEMVYIAEHLGYRVWEVRWRHRRLRPKDRLKGEK